MAPGFLRRRPQADAEAAAPAAKQLQASNSIGGPLVGGAVPLDSFLPDGVADATLASELQTFGHIVELHVNNCYRDDVVATSASSGPETLADYLRDNLYFWDDVAAELAQAAYVPLYRPYALRSVIAQAVLGNVVMPQPRTSIRHSLLPPGLTYLAASRPPVESAIGNKEAADLAFMRWRRMAVFLLHPRRSERSPLPALQTADDPGLDRRIAALVAVLAGFTRVFAKDGPAHEAALREVAREGAKLGYLMVSQPAEVQLMFGQKPVKTKAGGADGEAANGEGAYADRADEPTFFMLPGLMKSTDDQGRTLAKPLKLIDPVWM